MKLDLFDINEFIKLNKCKEVTNPIFFNIDGTPTSNGLFSYDLFGVTDEERKNIFGYIDLKGKYLHPLVYIMIMGRSGSLGSILTGDRYAVIANKKIKIVPETYSGAETGLDFLYKHFEEINWYNELTDAEIDSIDKKTRLKFLQSLKKEEFFVDKWLVLPPFYRAESSVNRSMGDSINKLYKELISKTKGMSLGFSMQIFGDETRLRIQNLLKDLYLSTTAPISGKNLILEKGKTEGELKGSGKNSMIRRALLGKTVEWGASSVITSPQNATANKLKNKPVPFGYGGFPLATLLSLFQPFFIQYICDFLETYLLYFANEFATQIKHIDVGQFDSDEVAKLIKRFIKSPKSRFEPILFEYTDLNGKKVSKRMAITEYKNKKDAYEEYESRIPAEERSKKGRRRALTATDVLYYTATKVLSDKHVYVTRYPIANFQNIYPSKIKVLSTAKTKDIYVAIATDRAPEHFEEYPSCPDDGKTPGIDNRFYDVMLCGNAYLDSLGGRHNCRHKIQQNR